MDRREEAIEVAERMTALGPERGEGLSSRDSAKFAAGVALLAIF